MNAGVVLLLIVSVSLSSAAQLLLKTGMSAPAVQAALAAGGIEAAVWAVATDLRILAGLGAFGASVVFWLLVLSRIDVSLAYPFVALGIVLTVVSGHLLLGETLSSLRVVGLVTIVAGVLVVALSGSTSRGRTAAALPPATGHDQPRS